MAFLNEDGEVVSIQKPRKYSELRKVNYDTAYTHSTVKPGVFRCELRMNKNGIQSMVPMAMTDADVAEIPDDLSYFDAFRKTCLDVAAAVAEGKTLSVIGKMEQMPSKRTILYWASKDPVFAACLEEARKWRAESFHDKVLEIADATEEENSKSSKVKVDAYKWAAEVGNRERFGSQARLTANANVNVNIVFQTGIERESIPAEGTVIEQATDDQDGVCPETAPGSITQEPK